VRMYLASLRVSTMEFQNDGDGVTNWDFTEDVRRCLDFVRKLSPLSPEELDALIEMASILYYIVGDAYMKYVHPEPVKGRGGPRKAVVVFGGPAWRDRVQQTAAASFMYAVSWERRKMVWSAVTQLPFTDVVNAVSLQLVNAVVSSVILHRCAAENPTAASPSSLRTNALAGTTRTPGEAKKEQYTNGWVVKSCTESAARAQHAPGVHRVFRVLTSSHTALLAPVLRRAKIMARSGMSLHRLHKAVNTYMNNFSSLVQSYSNARQLQLDREHHVVRTTQRLEQCQGYLVSEWRNIVKPLLDARKFKPGERPTEADIDTAGQKLRKKLVEFSMRVLIETADLKAHGKIDSFRKSIELKSKVKQLKHNRPIRMSAVSSRGNSMIQVVLWEPCETAGVELAYSEQDSRLLVKSVDKHAWRAASWKDAETQQPAEPLRVGDVIAQINDTCITGNGLQDVTDSVSRLSKDTPLKVVAYRDQRVSNLEQEVKHPVLKLTSVWRTQTSELGKCKGKRSRAADTLEGVNQRQKARVTDSRQ
jgi:hypothetical protein